MSTMKQRIVYLRQVKQVLDQGGWVKYTHATGLAELYPPNGKRSAFLDGRTYQGFLNDKLQGTLVRTRIGSLEEKNLVIEWRKK